MARRERKLRPSGEPYSSNPTERHAQLVADGKIGGRGAEDLARAHGALGGRPRNVRPVRVGVPEADVQDLLRAAEGAEREADRLGDLARRLRRRAESAGAAA